MFGPPKALLRKYLWVHTLSHKVFGRLGKTSYWTAGIKAWLSKTRTCQDLTPSMSSWSAKRAFLGKIHAQLGSKLVKDWFKIRKTHWSTQGDWKWHLGLNVFLACGKLQKKLWRNGKSLIGMDWSRQKHVKTMSCIKTSNERAKHGTSKTERLKSFLPPCIRSGIQRVHLQSSAVWKYPANRPAGLKPADLKWLKLIMGK